MNKLEELRKLAEAVEQHRIDDTITERARWSIKHADFIRKLDPQTIIAMCDLLERMRHTLANGPRFADAKDAVDAFDKFNNGER